MGRRITAKDCGGIVNYGIRLAGCTGINNEYDCKNATIPGWRDKDGERIRACAYDSEASGSNRCYNIIYPHRIHTFGNKDRFDGEVGGGDEDADTRFPEGQRPDPEDMIDYKRELAHDKMNNDKIDYNPMGKANTILDDDNINENDRLKTEDQVKIPDGPWVFVGGD